MSDENEILNEQEKSILLKHNYDGIEEFDYPLPAWWIWVFILTTVFAVIYSTYYFAMDGKSLKEEKIIELSALNKIRTAYALKLIKFDESAYAEAKTEEGLEAGVEVYEDNCLACHAEEGKGDIGPNLTDAYWIHAKGTSKSIYEVIVNGRADKGMPKWSEDLEKEEIYQVLAHVMTLHNTNADGGKEPQGEKVE
jgi:cytochrome c oxidase cbb3-type subunit 3